jgi:hypothetical protein
VIIPTRSQLLEGYIKVEQIVLVRPRGPLATEDMLGKDLGILWTNELLVVWGTDVHEGVWYRSGGLVGRMEWRIMNRVAIDFADVKVAFHFCDLFGDDAVGDAPDSVWSNIMGVNEGRPVGTLDQGNDSAGGLGSAAMVFTGLPEPTNIATDITGDSSI